MSKEEIELLKSLISLCGDILRGGTIYEWHDCLGCHAECEEPETEIIHEKDCDWTKAIQILERES